MTKCTCDNCKRWDKLIAHKKTFTPTELGLVGGRPAKQAYIEKLRGWQAQQCEQNQGEHMHYSNPKSHPAKILSSTEGKVDGYKNGWIECAQCGWRKELGNGFLQTTLETCAACDPTVATHTQSEVTVGRPGAYTIYHGHFTYMHTETIHVQIERRVTRTESRQRLPR